MDEPASAVMEGPGRRPGSSLEPFIAAVFWALAVVILVNTRGIFPQEDHPARLLFQVFRVLCCLLLMGLVHVRLPQALGTHGAWILGSMASYLVIGFFVSISTDAELLVNNYGFSLYGYVRNTVISLALVLSAALGGYAILERVGMQAFLRSVLMVLTASSAIVVFTPVLRSRGVLAPWQDLILVDSFRFVGTFWDPNSAGYIGCMTAALALAFLGNVRRPGLAYLALIAGFLAAVLSWSKTAIFSLGVLLVFFLLLNGRGGRGRLLIGVGALALAGVIFVQGITLGKAFKVQPAHLARLWTFVDILGGRLDDETLSLRGYFWKVGLRQVLESPVVGHGLGRMYLMDEGVFSKSQGIIGGVHNTYLLLWGEAGIVPLSLYLLYLFSLLRLRWTMPKSLVRDAIVGWTTIVVLQGMAFHQLFEVAIYVFPMGVTCAVASYAAHGSGGRTGETPRPFARTNAAPSATG